MHYSDPVECYSFDDGIDCYGVAGQYQQNVSSSGVVSLVGKETSTFSVSSPSVSYSVTYESQYHLLFSPKGARIDHERSGYTFTAADGTSCTVTDKYIYLNGQLLHDHPGLGCP